jgi:hypothetical protein
MVPLPESLVKSNSRRTLKLLWTKKEARPLEPGLENIQIALPAWWQE